MSLRDVLNYLGDLNHSTAYSIGLLNPRVVEGHFSEDLIGQRQKMFFDGLLDNGFERTRWQMTFPGQNAGLIRKVDPPLDGMDEIHVRFYEDGVISAEREYGRDSISHWRQRREPSVEVLEEILENELNLPVQDNAAIRAQFEIRDYDVVVEGKSGLSLLGDSLRGGVIKAFVLGQYLTSGSVALYAFSQGEIYFGLEPGIIALVETPMILGALMRESPTLRSPSSSPDV